MRDAYAVLMRVAISGVFCIVMTLVPQSVVASSSVMATSFLGCEAVFLSDSSPAPGMTPDRRDALAQAKLLFSRLSQADIDAALQGLASGQWRDLSDRFAGDDARWRFWRPMDVPNDPDALSLPPAQRQIMIRPLSDDQAIALLVAGLAGAGHGVAYPMLAGLRPSGEIFIIDPKQPEGCVWPLDGVAATAETFLQRLR